MKIKKMYQKKDKFLKRLKSWLLVLASPLAAQAESVPENEENGITKEITLPNDTTVHFNFVSNEMCDFSDSTRMVVDSLATDTLSSKKFDAFGKVMSLFDDALYVIAHFEGVKCQAYPDRNARNLPTIGIGNTIHANGRKVKLGDCFYSEKELTECVRVHIAERIAPIMARSLDIEKMGDAQIVALIDFAYNCGAEIFETNGQPTKLTNDINDFVQNGSEAALQDIDKYLRVTKSYSEGKRFSPLVKRRTFEFRMFAENDIDLLKACREANLGVVYGFSVRNIQEDNDLAERIKKIAIGYNLSDTISKQVKALLPGYRKRSGRE